jgi:hypothetical protein
MRPNAIYSKSGKGVQEASGKTSLLKREHRAVLAAIDGRATLADVAQKSGNAYDADFQRLIIQLDKDGFIREVSSGAGAGPAAGAAKPAGKLDTAIDLDFSSLASSQKANTAPQPTAPPPPAPKAPAVDMAAKAAAERRAKEQESALHRARKEAEEKAQAERERQRAEAEAKVRAETEAKLRVEAEKKLREEAAHRVRADAVAKAQADAEARVKAVRESAARIAAEQKAKAETELKAKLDAERKAREEAERSRREAEEKARREQEELRRRLEEERRAREEVERKAREEAERIRQEAEEQARRETEALRQQIEEERKAREAAERSAREEMSRARQEREERARRAEERKQKQSEAPGEAPPPPPPPRPQPAPGGDKFADSLFADLDSFNKREEENRKKDEEAERAKKEERVRKAREMEELRAREEEEQRKAEEKQLAREEEERRTREEQERLARENEERERKFREEEDKRAQESEERARKAKEEDILAAKTRGAMASGGDSSLQDRRAKAMKRGPGIAAAHRRQERNWGKPVTIGLLVILGAALGALHVIPISTADYEKAAREALGQPVRVGSARISLWRGVHYEFKDVRIGERVRIAEARAFPALDALFDEKKIFKRIELEGATLPQDVLGEALFAKANGENFTLGRVVATQLKLEGPLPLPPLDVDVALDATGVPRVASLAGPENLVVNLSSKGAELEFEMSASSFTLPIAPELSLDQFGMKGTITRRGMNISAWDGAALNGTVSGTAQVRWGGTWNVEGVVTARGINAAVFAPALLAEGRGGGTGRFWMTGSEPAKLASGGRLEGNFTINKGVLGSFDLSSAIQTGGRQVTGRTRFTEMNGQATYNAGAVALRNVNIGAGALNAGASADIAQSGALSGRIVIDVRTSAQALRGILILGGTVKEPQVTN